jgi:hypothetical protein
MPLANDTVATALHKGHVALLPVVMVIHSDGAESENVIFRKPRDKNCGRNLLSRVICLSRATLHLGLEPSRHTCIQRGRHALPRASDYRSIVQ